MIYSGTISFKEKIKEKKKMSRGSPYFTYSGTIFSCTFLCFTLVASDIISPFPCLFFVLLIHGDCQVMGRHPIIYCNAVTEKDPQVICQKEEEGPKAGSQDDGKDGY